MAFETLDTTDLVRRMPLVTRVLLKLFRGRLNRDVFSPVLNRAYERQVINSQQLHSLHHHFDPTQRGVIGTV